MIVENFLPLRTQNQIKRLVCDCNFNWFWRDGLIVFDREKNKNSKTAKLYPKPEAPMFMHQISKYENIINEPLYARLIVPFLKKWSKNTKLKVKQIKRSQLNLYPRVSIIPEEHEGSLHRDVQYSEMLDNTKHISILYFVIDSDGPTIVYDDDKNIIERGEPKQGNIMYYPSIMLHQPCVPVLHPRRITLQIEVEVY